ncbi:MAG: hypothetical protein GY869_16885, partial [Planctomycetes bacterium]|nr:hypothetical protein [Planctomycetota bacterium]
DTDADGDTDIDGGTIKDGGSDGGDFDGGGNDAGLDISGFIYVKHWGSQGAGDGEFDRPQGIAMVPRVAKDWSSGTLYIAEQANNRVQFFDFKGSFIEKHGTYGSDDGLFNGPYGIAVDSLGNIFITDMGNSRIQQMGSDGAYQMQFGEYGNKGNSRFQGPRGIAIAPTTGEIFVVDRGNQRIQVFLSDGTYSW